MGCETATAADEMPCEGATAVGAAAESSADGAVEEIATEEATVDKPAEGAVATFAGAAGRAVGWVRFATGGGGGGSP